MARPLRAFLLVVLLGLAQVEAAFALACAGDEVATAAGVPHDAGACAGDGGAPHDAPPSRVPAHDLAGCQAMLDCAGIAALPPAVPALRAAPAVVRAPHVLLTALQSRDTAPANPPPRS